MENGPADYLSGQHNASGIDLGRIYQPMKEARAYRLVVQTKYTPQRQNHHHQQKPIESLGTFCLYQHIFFITPITMLLRVYPYNDLKKAFNRMEADNATRNYENTFRTLKEQYEQEKVLCHRYKDTLLRIRGILSAKKLMLTEADEQAVEDESINQSEL